MKYTYIFERTGSGGRGGADLWVLLVDTDDDVVVRVWMDAVGVIEDIEDWKPEHRQASALAAAEAQRKESHGYVYHTHHHGWHLPGHVEEEKMYMLDVIELAQAEHYIIP